MKKIFFVVLYLAVNATVHSQKFEFDLLTKYVISAKNHQRETAVYSNSTNKFYYLYLNFDSKTAGLYDLKTNILYKFEVLQSKVNQDVFFEFKYLNSKKTTSNGHFANFESEYTIVKKDSIFSEIKLDIYRNSKRKKPQYSLLLKAKKSKTNLFAIFRVNCLHPIEFNSKIDIPENIIIESGESIHGSGNKINYKLAIVKDVKFELEIPQNQIWEY